MELVDIDITNFGAVGHIHINYAHKGLVLIEGDNQDSESFDSNGASKTVSYAESLIYALYGTTLKGDSGDAVINTKFGKGTAVILNFKMQGMDYRIERYRKHKKNKNKVFFFINDEDYTQSSAKLTDTLIQNTIGIDFTTFTNSVVFGQGQVKLFSQATDKERKEILEELANLAIYNRAEVIAKDAYKETQQTMTNLDRESEQLFREEQNITQLEQSEKAQYEQFRAQFSGCEDEIKRSKEAVDRFERENAPLFNDLNLRIGELHQQIKQQDRPVAKKNEKINEDMRRVYGEVCRLNNEVKGIKGQLAQQNQQYESISNSKICPVCGQVMDQDHVQKEKKRLEAILQTLIQNYTTTVEQYTQKSAAYNEVLSESASLKTALDEENKRIAKLSQELNECESRKNKLIATRQGYLNDYNSAEDAYNRFKNVPVPKPKDKERAELKVKQGDLLKRRDKTQKDLDEYEQVVELYSNQGVKSHVLDLITPFLNERANAYMNVLSDATVEVTFSTQKKNKDGSVSDKFDIEVKNEFGGDSYSSSSQGERRRIDLAISLAIQDLLLSKSNLKTNVVFYDECFDGLDAIGCERVIGLLKDRLKAVPSIFVMTHNPYLRPLFDQTVTVVKKNGIASLLEEGSSS